MSQRPVGRLCAAGSGESAVATPGVPLVISGAGVGDPNDEVIDHGGPEWQGASIDNPGGDVAEFVVGVLAGDDQQLETLLRGQTTVEEMMRVCMIED